MTALQAATTLVTVARTKDVKICSEVTANNDIYITHFLYMQSEMYMQSEINICIKDYLCYLRAITIFLHRTLLSSLPTKLLISETINMASSMVYIMQYYQTDCFKFLFST